MDNDMCCGLCKFYDGEYLWCEKHLNYGEMVEMDSCDDYEELP